MYCATASCAACTASLLRTCEAVSAVSVCCSRSIHCSSDDSSAHGLDQSSTITTAVCARAPGAARAQRSRSPKAASPSSCQIPIRPRLSVSFRSLLKTRHKSHRAWLVPPSSSSLTSVYVYDSATSSTVGAAVSAAFFQRLINVDFPAPRSPVHCFGYDQKGTARERACYRGRAAGAPAERATTPPRTGPGSTVCQRSFSIFCAENNLNNYQPHLIRKLGDRTNRRGRNRDGRMRRM